MGIDAVWPHCVPEEDIDKTEFSYNDEISDPIHVLFIRNPYKRIVSGFLEKLTAKHDHGGQIVFNVDANHTFESFVLGLKDHSIFRDRHFFPQTAGAYNPEIKFDRVFDIEHIDRQYLDRLFGRSVEDPVYKGYFTPYRPYDGEKPAYRLTIAELNQLGEKPAYLQFYNEEIRQAVERLFEDDFNLFRRLGVIYDCS